MSVDKLKKIVETLIDANSFIITIWHHIVVNNPYIWLIVVN